MNERNDMQIVEVDAHDDAAFGGWHEVYATSQRHDRGAELADIWQAEELRLLLTEPSVRAWCGAYAGLVDGHAVSAGFIRTPLLDNLERAEMAIDVLPEHRRRGFGSAMLEHLESIARERGRTTLVGEAAFAYDDAPDGSGKTGPEFARARGFSLALGEVKRDLRLPVPDEALEELAVEAAQRHATYTLRSWPGSVPDDLVEGWVKLSSSLDTEAPVGDLEVEPRKPDIAAYREGEELARKQGRTKYNTVALDADGTVVAYTDIGTTVHEPGVAYQWGTLVHRDHRGHRLGLAVKVANLRLLQRERPDIHHVVTYNAEVNAHMVGVNERLGFVPVERFGQFQKKLV